jgi:LuxR family transcriptional regulator, maltose regulon positive regulatory protein
MDLIRKQKAHPARVFDGLISTKTDMPRFRSKMVERTRLLDRLSEARDLPLIVISGVAGSGKTSLVCQWASRDALGMAWYSVDKSDNDTSLFSQYLLASLSVADDRLATLFGPEVRHAEVFADKHLITYLIRSVADLSKDLYLVLDDFHHITSRAVCDMVTSLLNRQPPNLHVVILTRYGVPFSLSPFRVRNQIMEISSLEMRFTELEAEHFFAEIIPVKLTRQETHEIARHMDGWVGGMQLLGLSLHGRDVPGNLGELLNKGNQRVWDYLIEEVTAVQSPRIRGFLEATAPLDRFSAELARALTGMEDAGEVLETVYRNNLFLAPLDSGSTWYRYHHLLSEAVRERMRAASPEKLSNFYRQAAQWFAAHGHMEDAFQNAFASGDFEFAADLIEDHVLQMNDGYEYTVGSRRLAAKLPEQVFRNRMLLRLHDCRHKIEDFRLADIEAVLGDIEKDRDHAFDRYHGDKRFYCEDVYTYFHYVIHYYYRDPAHPVPEQLEKAFGMISAKNDLFAGYLKTVIAWSQISLGNPLKAETALEEALPLIISSGKLWARVLWFRLSATVHRLRGRLRTSEAVLKEGFEFLREKNLDKASLRHFLYVPLAWVYYQRNEIENAAKYASAAVSHGEQVGFVRDVAEGNLLLALVDMAAGKTVESEECLRKIRLVSEKQGIPETGFSPEPWLIHLSMAEGDVRRAVEWSDRRNLLIDDNFSIESLRNSMVQVELLIRERHYRKAVSILQKLRPRCVDRGMMEAVLDIDIALCVAFYADKHHERAGHVMEGALSFAESEGYVRPFLNYAAMIFPLLSDMRVADLGLRQFLQLKTIMAACTVDGKGLVGATARFRKDRSKALTDREVEILGLMAAGHRYQDIAKRIFISVETVKTHVKHIFGKLDVTTKTQAIRRAEDLRLLHEKPGLSSHCNTTALGRTSRFLECGFCRWGVEQAREARLERKGPQVLHRKKETTE